MSKEPNHEIRMAKAAGQNIGQLLQAPEGMYILKAGIKEPVKWILAIEFPDGHMKIVETLPNMEISQNIEAIKFR